MMLKSILFWEWVCRFLSGIGYGLLLGTFWAPNNIQGVIGFVMSISFWLLASRLFRKRIAEEFR